MYLMEPKYRAAAAFVLGYDLALAGGVLVGFREWLVPRVGSGNNLSWPALVLRATFPEVPDPIAHVSSSAETERYAIDCLFQLIAEFDDVRQAPEGLRRVYWEYERWLKTQTWYVPGSPSWVSLADDS